MYGSVRLLLLLGASGTILCACFSATAGGSGSSDASGDEPARDGGGADAPAADGALDARLTRRRFLDARRAALCEYQTRCAPRDRRRDICSPVVPDRWERVVTDAAVEGAVRFDPEAAERCLSAMRRATESCASQMSGWFRGEPDRTSISESCDAVFVGTLAEDDPCIPGSGGCSGDLSCRRWDGAYVCAPLTRSAIGDRCEHQLDCESPDAWCDAHVCVAYADAGEACSTSGAPRCAPELDCIDGTCRFERLGEGEPCDGSLRCADPLTCAAGRCQRRAAVGEPCEDLPCERDLYCREGEGGLTCRSSGGDAEGDECVARLRSLGSSCSTGLVCDSIFWVDSLDLGLGECRRGAVAGEACGPREPCDRGGVCVDFVCRSAALPDAECDVDDVCPKDHRCQGGHCRPRPGPGDACDEAEGCAKGRCVDGVCCLVAAGQACEPDPRGLVWEECDGLCLADGRCFDPGPACAGCDACWPASDRCVPLCPPG